jgi:23S rRNA pseudouridine1911/1915/1917 synthase
MNEVSFQDIEDQDDNELFEHFRLVVDPGQSLLRVDKFLCNRIEGTSRNRIQLAAEAGSIQANGVAVKSNYRVKPGDVISLVLDFPKRELKIIAEDIPLDVVYEDNCLLLINKPAGLVVHPGHGNYSGTLVNGLAYRFRNLPLFNSEDPRPGLVHRIDKDTSGLLVVAKTEQAKNHLALQFFNKTTKRRYQALVWGVPPNGEGTITGHIGRSARDRQVFTVYPDGDHGKHAVTHYTVLKDFGYVSLVECRLETGRTHQIRVHMKHIGHPLFNDKTYGGDQILRGTTFAKYNQFVQNCFDLCPRQALHAKSLGFIHPETGKEMYFESELASDLQTVISKWENYAAAKLEM